MIKTLIGFALLTLSAILAGVLLGIVTSAVERAGIEGSGWSLRGNGALIIPACGLPPILISTWAVLARWLAADRRSCLGGVGAGVLALFISLFALNLSRDLWLLLLAISLLVALLLARRSGRPRAIGWLMASALVLPIAAYVGVLAGANLISP